MSEPIRSYDVAETLSDVGFYKTLFHLYWNTRKISIPAIVKAIETDDKDGRIIVQPLLNFAMATKDGPKGVKRPEVKVWPLQVKHGGFIIKAPLRVGDTGYLVSGDRSITDMVKKNSSIVKDDVDSYEKSENSGPVDLEDYTSNEWEFGFFMPCSWNNEPFGVEDYEKKLIVGNLSEGEESAYITIDRDGNIVVHGLKLTIEADVDIQGDLDVQGDINAHSDVNIDGDLTVEGDVYFRNNIHIDGKIVIEQEDEEEEETIDLIDTDLVTGYDEESNSLLLWHGKVMRSETGEESTIQLKEGGGGGGGDVDAVADVSAEGSTGTGDSAGILVAYTTPDKSPKKIKLVAGTNTNLTVTEANGDLKIGVYYS